MPIESDSHHILFSFETINYYFCGGGGGDVLLGRAECGEEREREGWHSGESEDPRGLFIVEVARRWRGFNAHDL